jgi:hypothetical protein
MKLYEVNYININDDNQVIRIYAENKIMIRLILKIETSYYCKKILSIKIQNNKLT